MDRGILSGLINGTEQVVYDREITAGEGAQSSISTGNILNGDEDGWYTIIFRLVGVTASAITPVLRFNADSAANYGRRGIDAANTTVANDTGTGEGGIYVGYVGASGESGLWVGKVYAKSGAVRLVNGIHSGRISTTTVTSITTRSSVWSNTADNITAMSVSSGGNDLGIGTRIIILKSNNFTNGTPTGVITTPYIKGAWVRVGSQVLGSAATSVTFSGLDGDRDVLYYLSAQIKAGGTSPTRIYVNNDSTAEKYGYQNLRAAATSVAAVRGTFSALLAGYNTTTVGLYCSFNMMLFAKTGFIRPGITTSTGLINGTSVGEITTNGVVYNETGTNITSLVIGTAGSPTYDTGSQFDLYALRPNG